VLINQLMFISYFVTIISASQLFLMFVFDVLAIYLHINTQQLCIASMFLSAVEAVWHYIELIGWVRRCLGACIGASVHSFMGDWLGAWLIALSSIK